MFWQNMNITLTERIYRTILVFLSTLVLIVSSFFVIYGLHNNPVLEVQLAGFWVPSNLHFIRIGGCSWPPPHTDDRIAVLTHIPVTVDTDSAVLVDSTTTLVGWVGRVGWVGWVRWVDWVR